MIRLRPMTAAERTAFLQGSLLPYAGDIERNFDVSSEAAMAKASEDVGRRIDGAGDPDDRFQVAEDRASNEVVGQLWWGPNEHLGVRRAYVYYVVVEPAARGRGYGRAIMGAFAEAARREGYVELALHVFGDNDVARAMYRKLGYVDSSVVMRRSL